MARDFDAELRALARLKADADDSISRRLDTRVRIIQGIYAILVAVVAIAIYVVTIRNDVNRLEEKQKADRALLNQLYERNFGVKITFGN